MAEVTGNDILARCLKAQGVKDIFFIMGGPMLDAELCLLTFHDLRHHFASWFVMRGGRLEALQQILGHATLAMTMRYAHLAPDFVRQEMARTERERSPALLAHKWPKRSTSLGAAGLLRRKYQKLLEPGAGVEPATY